MTLKILPNHASYKFSMTRLTSAIGQFFPFWPVSSESPRSYSTQFPWRINLGHLPFTWENRKFRWQNQMVHAMLFGKLWKIWPVIEGDNLVPRSHSV